MKTVLSIATAIAISAVTPSFAGDREVLGWGYLLSNDAIGDRRDRWRSASTALSQVRGQPWTGERPTGFGELIELRLRSEVISPANVTTPAANDRRYVGALSFGAHTHFARRGVEYAVGLDLIVVGPQTRLDRLQDSVHDLIGDPDVNVANFQVANAIYPTLTAEVARTFSFGASGRARPFAELQVGAETLVRIGGDVTIGSFGLGSLLARDVSTGQRYAVMDDDNTGFSVVLGADAAYVADSRYLATPGIVTEDARYRLRAGLNQAWRSGSVFYGATYLSEEFSAQAEGQVVGSLNARFDF